MIVIEILNIEQLVERQAGGLASFLGQIGRVDLEGRVEKEIIDRLKLALETEGVSARFHSVGNVKYTTTTKRGGTNS